MAPKLPAVLLAACAVLLALAAPLLAGDPDMLQDICVADYKSLQGRESITRTRSNASAISLCSSYTFLHVH